MRLALSCESILHGVDSLDFLTAIIAVLCPETRILLSEVQAVKGITFHPTQSLEASHCVELAVNTVLFTTFIN